MTDVEYKPDNSVSIKSAIVTYTGLSKAELTRMMSEANVYLGIQHQITKFS
jgi:hypothetical protein